jgi:hypothetical protein
MVGTEVGSHEYELLMQCRKLNAGIMRQVWYDADQNPIAMVVTIDGKEDCETLMGIIVAMENDR